MLAQCVDNLQITSRISVLRTLQGTAFSDSGKSENRAIIAETTPRIRQQHPNWTTAKLAQWKGNGSPVRLSGWLMLDPEHPDEVGRHRGTIWEIHPVTKIEVQQNGAWVDLDTLQ